MSRLTRDGTAEPVSQDQILRRELGHGNIHFPVQLTTSRIGNLTRLIHTLLYVMTIHKLCSRYYPEHHFGGGQDCVLRLAAYMEELEKESLGTVARVAISF